MTMTHYDHFFLLPRMPGRPFDDSGAALVVVAWRFATFSSSKGILGWRASWWICIDFTSGAVTLQCGHSYFACPPFSTPDRSAWPALPPPRLVVAASILAAISLAVCFLGFAFPVMASSAGLCYRMIVLLFSLMVWILGKKRVIWNRGW